MLTLLLKEIQQRITIPGKTFDGDSPVLRVAMIPGRKAPNPYFSLLCESIEKLGVRIVEARSAGTFLGQFDILHINFPNHYVTEFSLLRAFINALGILTVLLILRLSGKTLVYMVHDVEPLHKRNKWLLRRYIAGVNELTQGLVFLSQSSRIEFFRLFPSTQSKSQIEVAHGPYPTTLLSCSERDERRYELTGKGDDFVVGYLGAIKYYKNPRALCRLPKQLPNGRRVHLVIAGKIETSIESEMAEILQAVLPSQTKILRHLDREELNELIQVVDVMFLPYSAGFNSGVAMLCLSNRARIVGSTLPMFLELEARLGKPWVYTWNSESEAATSELGDVLQSAAGTDPSSRDQSALASFLKESSFDNSSQSIGEFYRDLRRLPGSC